MESLEEKHESYNGCFSGDCPHGHANDCVDALEQHVGKLEAENAKLREALEWIKESGEILYKNELANQAYVLLVQQYRKHLKVATAALGTEGS